MPAQLRLGDLTHRRPAARFAAWTARLGNGVHPHYRAVDLYAGEHWQVARTFTTDTPAAKKAMLWIASAGYGLIPADTAICAYSATFSAAARDTVGASLAEVADWWQRLGDWPGPEPDRPRTLTDLARRGPDATIVAVLSEAYQRACGDDLLSAATILGTDALSVVGPPDAHPQLADVLVPVTATMRHTVGGSLQALNVRAAKYLLEHTADSSRAALREAACAAVPANPPVPRKAGQRMSDAEVRAYIRAQPSTSATQSLRQLRDTGRSCEQGRFGRLHAEIREQVHRP
ncbi:hypothetical protein [Dactylosporangium roseum]|uniref:hypothetical protein n=1 Tax=Dactylosporangium roseum TaxID=47989 RepID=UPI0021B1E1E4|nr:hypothetical protein [Dactylosporangium roseum]